MTSHLIYCQTLVSDRTTNRVAGGKHSDTHAHKQTHLILPFIQDLSRTVLHRKSKSTFKNED